MRTIATTLATTLILTIPLANAGDGAKYCLTPDRNPIGHDYKVWVANNCKSGDIIQAWAVEVPYLCDMDEPTITSGERTTCVYRGERRKVRGE